MVKDTEIWRKVPGQPEIMASSWGRIIRQPRYVPLPQGGMRGYMPKPNYGVVTRAHTGAAHSYRAYHYRGIGNVKVHQLVCAAFHGPKPFEKAVVIHIDENAHNNRPENLKWGTQKENLAAPGFREYIRTRPNPVKVHQARRAREDLTCRK